MRTRFLITLLSIAAIFLLVGSLSAQDEAAPFLGLQVDANDAGLVVVNVVPGSAAATAGVEADDVLTAINGDDVTSYDGLVETLSGYAVGDTITLDLLRDDEALSLDATLQARPARRISPQIQIMPDMMQRAYLGVNLNFTSLGVIVESVEPDSPADAAGILSGDQITAVGDTMISTPADVATAIRDLEPGDSITLSIARDDETIEVEVTLGERDFPDVFRGDFGGRLNGDIVIYDGASWQIVTLSDDSALAEAGLQSGDVITAVDGETMDPAALADYLDGLEDDATVSLSVTRGDESLDISVSAADLAAFNRFGFNFRGPRNGPQGFEGLPFGFFQGNGTWLGVEVQMLDAGVAAEHDLDVTEGALISTVAEDSPAAEAGLQTGDVVVAVNGDVVDAQRTLRERLYAYDAGDTVTLDVLRGGEHLSLDVTLGTLADANLPGFFSGPGDQNGRGPRFFFGPNGNGPQPGNPNGSTAPQVAPGTGANI